MARPNTDVSAIRAILLDKVETLIKRRGAASVTLTELANEVGMSPANIYRFFESKEALYEAVAERWFAPKIKIMEDVVASELPAPQKLYEFYARRFRLMRDNHKADPALFVSYCELGEAHHEIVRGYIDLGDHYLAMIVSEAIEAGHFAGLSIDEAVSLINLMVVPFTKPNIIMALADTLTELRLAAVIDAILGGLKSRPPLMLVSAVSRAA